MFLSLHFLNFIKGNFSIEYEILYFSSTLNLYWWECKMSYFSPLMFSLLYLFGA